MRRVFRVVAVLMGAGTLIAPRVDATGNCGCDSGPCRCYYVANVSNTCKCSGSLCISGGGGNRCEEGDNGLAASDMDGASAGTSIILAEAERSVMLSRRACDGAVVERVYGRTAASELRRTTQAIRV